MDKVPMSNGIASISIGVADMRAVTELWVEQLGLEVIARRRGADPELGHLWNLPADEFADQLLLATPGAAMGHLHFVQFCKPGKAVRAGAAAIDLGAKNLDINCTAMPDRVAALQAAGCRFRSAIGEYEVDGLRAREVQLPAHDGLNIVLIEILNGGFEVAYSHQGFAAVTSFVVIVVDTAAESLFYRDVFALQEIMHHRISGPGIEQAAGLPAGTVLDMRLLGDPDNLFGRIELISYEDWPGADRFQLAVPPATGILGCSIQVSSISAIRNRAAQHAIAVSSASTVDLLTGSGRYATLHSPAGLRIELFEAMRR